MSLLRRDTIINDKMYSILLPSPRQVMPVCTKLATLFGAVIPTLLKDGKAGGMDAFGAALKNLDSEALDNLFTKVIEISHLCCNNEAISAPIEFDKHFSQYRNEVYQVCLWTLWECVKDFFPQLDGFNLNSILQGASPSQKDGQ